MTSGPSEVIVLAKKEGVGETVIEEVRNLVGPAKVEEAKQVAPTSLRAQFGTDNYVNAIHAADSKDSAARYITV